MPSWWGKSSSKEVKKKSSKENFIDTIQRLINPASQKVTAKLGSSLRRGREKHQKCSRSAVASRSPSPSTQVSRCQSFSNTSHAHLLPLPLPQVPASDFISQPSLPKIASPILQKRGKPPLHLPFPPPHSTLNRPVTVYTDTDLTTASVSSNCSAESEDTPDSATNNILSVASKGASRNSSPRNGREVTKPKNSTLGNQAFASAPDSSLSSPARSPRRPVYPDHIPTSVFLGTRPYHDISLIGSGQCSSPGSGQTSGHNSMGGDLSSQMFWLHSRGSTECSPIPSPKMASPGPNSRIHSGAVSPLHPCACGNAPESPIQRHRLPLPPIGNPSSSYFQSPISLSNCPSPYPRSPGRQDNPTSPGLRWKKGKLIGRGTFGHVYIGFNSENGEMRAIKEVTLFSDDAKSKECAKQLGQEIALLSRLRHPNIVRNHGSDMLGDKLYIYLEYVSGGSIHKLLQEYGRFGELAIRNYTRQILSGLAYLHGMNTVHRDIKGANILVDPKGRIKLADFGMAKHITGQSCPLSFKGSPYWMAPEVIKNSNGCNLAVDIWSLGCTVLEMATSKPPWSQYEGIAAMFKIGNSKELPTIPDHLSEEGKDFVRQCLQRDPSNRPTAVQLLGHPFVRSAAPAPRPASGSEPSEPPSADPTKSGGQVQGSSLADVQGLTIQRPKSSKPTSPSSCQMRNMSCPVSPRAVSGSSTPRRLPTAAPPHPAWTRK